MNAKEKRKDYRSRPEVKSKIEEYRNRPEVKERRKEVYKEYYSRPEIQERIKEYRRKNKERMKEYRKEYDTRPETKEIRRKYVQKLEVKQKAKERAINKQTLLWKQLFDIYGWECVCCGEDNADFLTLDHINKDGGQERMRLGNQRKVLENASMIKDTTKYQILCYNCNAGRAQRGIDGVCPHKLPKNWRYENY